MSSYEDYKQRQSIMPVSEESLTKNSHADAATGPLGELYIAPTPINLNMFLALNCMSNQGLQFLQVFVIFIYIRFINFNSLYHILFLYQVSSRKNELIPLLIPA